jgi:GNAT superfamily N-acetyltransferase
MPTVEVATQEYVNVITSWQLAMAQETESLVLNPETVRKGVSRVFECPSIGFYLLAFIDKTPVGCCLILREWSDWRNGDVLWLHSVYTEPAHRRQGVFKSLYRHLQQLLADDYTLRGLRLYVDKRNQAACSTYEHFGMDRDHYYLYEKMK